MRKKVNIILEQNTREKKRQKSGKTSTEFSTQTI